MRMRVHRAADAMEGANGELDVLMVHADGSGCTGDDNCLDTLALIAMAYLLVAAAMSSWHAHPARSPHAPPAVRRGTSPAERPSCWLLAVLT